LEHQRATLTVTPVQAPQENPGLDRPAFPSTRHRQALFRSYRKQNDSGDNGVAALIAQACVLRLRPRSERIDDCVTFDCIVLRNVAKCVSPSHADIASRICV
jgi:hypothetical protein